MRSSTILYSSIFALVMAASLPAVSLAQTDPAKPWKSDKPVVRETAREEFYIQFIEHSRGADAAGRDSERERLANMFRQTSPVQPEPLDHNSLRREDERLTNVFRIISRSDTRNKVTQGQVPKKHFLELGFREIWLPQGDGSE